MLTLIKGNVKPYHSEFAANNISKFGLKEKDAIKAIGGDEGWWDYIKIGNADRDEKFTKFLQKAGWYPITLDDGMNGIAEFGEPVTPRTVHKIAVALDKKYGDRLWAKSYSMFEIGVDGHRKNIQNKFEWEQYLKNKNVPRRTATGAVMAQFREEYITELFEKPYPFKQTDSIDLRLQMGIDRLNDGSFDPDEHAVNGGVEYDVALYTFNTKNGIKIEVSFEYEIIYKGSGEYISSSDIAFKSVGAEGRKNKAFDSDLDMTGEGDEFKIMSTVMKIISDDTKNVRPDEITFSSAKGQVTTPGKKKQNTGRTKLYTAMVKRFAGKAGYKVKKIKDDKAVHRFSLVKK